MRWVLLLLLLLAVVLVPYVLFEERFAALASRVVAGESRTYVAGGVGVLLASDVLLPVPSSVVSVAAGMLLGFWRAAATIWLGMSAACAIGYAVGRKTSGLARRLVGADSLGRASRLLSRHGDYAFVVSRPVPVVAEATVILAGLTGASFTRFMLVTTAANFGIALAYAGIGAFSLRVESLPVALAGAVIVPALAWIVVRLWTGPRRTGSG